MATATVLQEADSPTRKRSFSDNDSPTFPPCPSPKKVEFCLPNIQLVTPTPLRPSRRIYTAEHRRRASLDKTVRTQRRANMQSQNPRAFSHPMNSFMSVFGDEANRSSVNDFADHNASTTHTHTSKQNTTDENCFSPIEQSSFPPFHQPRDSTSTSASESTESSPTTTVSTLDSSSMTEPSPGPSPESPAPMTFVMDASRFRPMDKVKPEPLKTPFFEMQRPSTPAKKPRNLKNLAVNTAGSYNLGRAVSTAPFKPDAANGDRVSAPASPAFVKPPTPPRRKLANIGLTIMTPANSKLPKMNMPSTPLLTRPGTLRHFQSSPSLPLYTSGAGPTGGMTLPTLRTLPPPRGFAEVPLEDEEDYQNFDVPQSREEKPESYPHGPIRIYESGVDLYYEPSAEVASRYDVVLNVASEVKNPFDVAAQLKGSQPSTTVGVLVESSQQTGSPTTPKATPISAAPVNTFDEKLPEKRPEYIHIPWEHNTDIVPELYDLVKLIDDRVQQGKTVLVHCQCGVSRSASLIVAYGLYKNLGISVQEAYDAVKARSKWIGPNMNLIMQLQEFRSGLMRRNGCQDGHQNQMFASPRKSSTLPSASFTDNYESRTPSDPPTPRTCPLPPDPQSPQRLNSADLGPFSAGPVEPGSGPFWEPSIHPSWGPGQSTHNLSFPNDTLMGGTPYVDTKGHVIPMIAVVQTEQSPMGPPPAPRHSQYGDGVKKYNPLNRQTVNFSRQLPLRRDYDNDTAMTDAPQEALISPRSEEFHMAPVRHHAKAPSHDMFNILSPFTTQFPKSQVSAAPPMNPLVSPRSEEFHMTPLRPSATVESHDSYNILSPFSTEFPKPSSKELLSSSPMVSPRSEEFHMAPLKQPAEVESHDTFNILSPHVTEFPKNVHDLSPPRPTRAPPPPPTRELPMESLNAIFSPTSGSFPSLHSAQPLQSLQNYNGFIFEDKPAVRSDSMHPAPSPSFTLHEAPKPNRRLRQKFSAPNLSECIKLQKIQTDIANKLAQRPAEAEEVLMSPRAGEFVANPFHIGAPIKEELQVADAAREQTIAELRLPQSDALPVTPTVSESDPRSPAQTGISPITRNIWGVL